MTTRSLRLLALALLAALASLALIQLGPRRITSAVGGLITLGGLALLIASRRQLGSAFAIAPQAKTLVTSGIYAKIPHPMYVFLDLFLLGGIIILREPWLIFFVVAVAAAQVWQARREAVVLEQAFGDAYREYRSRTWW